MWTVNFQMLKLVLGKAEEADIKLTTSAGSWKKQESSRKISVSALLATPKPLTVWITINCGKFFRDGNTRSPYLPPEKSVSGQEATLRTGHGTMDLFQIGKGVCQGCMLPPCLFNLYQSTSCECQTEWSSSLESRLLGEISIALDMQIIPLLWQKAKRK